MRKNDPCQSNCCYVECVDHLNNVITKSTLYQLKRFVQNNCQTALFRPDSNGRYPLHVAASSGNLEIVDWLISIGINAKKSLKLTINVLDKESGWSALHRAIYYGRIPVVVSLLKNGADLWIKDKDGCNALDIMVKDIAPWFRQPILKRNSCSNHVIEKWSDLRKSGPNDVYAWGANENMTLGNSGAKSRFVPESVALFVKKKLSIKQISNAVELEDDFTEYDACDQVAMCKYHTLFLTHCGAVYACGNGRDGRFGIEKESVLIEPRLVPIGEKITCVAASTNHSVFVSETGQLYTCGSNHFCVLGIKPPPVRCMQPTLVTAMLGHGVIGCAAGFCHTIVWSRYGLFSFGTNSGQMGHGKGDLFIVEPREVSQFHGKDSSIAHVHTCDAATVVATTQGMIYLLHRYHCRKILSRHMDVIKLQVGGGCLDPDILSQVKSFDAYRPSYKVAEKDANPIRVLILKSGGHMLSWTGQYYSIDHCQFNDSQLRWVRDVAISRNGAVVMLVSIDGTAYRAEYSNRIRGKRKPKQEYFSSLELAQSDSTQKFAVKQVACALRAHTAHLGPKGSNAALLQCRPSTFVTEVPIIDPSNLFSNLAEFFSNTTETDLIHDVIIRIKCFHKPDVTLPAHLFVLSSRSKYFSQLIQEESEKRKNNIGDDFDDVEDSDVAEDDDNKTFKITYWPELIVENVHPEIFREFLFFLYSNKSAILESDASSLDDVMENLGSVSVYWSGSKRPRSKSKRKLSKVDRQSLLKALLTEFEVKHYVPVLNARDSDDSDSCSTLPEPSSRVGFSPFTFPHLYDCVVECSDEVTFNAHKCILAARIPYFSGMLSSSWLLVDEEIPTLKVPVPSNVFRFVLKFSYSDSESCLNQANTIELLCETLGATDLLLMDRMKQIVEAHIVPQLTLKNVASVCDVALAFNATQLHDSCLQFCCHHLPALLQTTPFFSTINDESLDKMESVYRSLLPNVYMRAVPPSNEGPCIDYLPQFGSDLDDDFLFVFEKEKPHVKSVSKRKKSSSEFERKKSLKSKSMGVLVSDLLKKREKSEKKNSESNKSKQKNLDKKVKSSKKKKKERHSATPIEENAGKEETPVKRNDGESVGAGPTSEQLKSYANYNRLFPQLGAEPVTLPRVTSENASFPPNQDAKSPNNCGVPSVGAFKVKKMSKKERKKARSEAQKKTATTAIDIEKPAPNAWGVPLKSPDDYVNNVSSPLSPDRFSTSSTVVFPELSKLPSYEKKGPWQNAPVTTIGSPPASAGYSKYDSSASVSSKPSSFMDIVKDELKAKELLQEYKSKPMDLIQLEDTAMHELKSFYEKSNKSSRIFFTVSRLPADVAREITELRISTKK